MHILADAISRSEDFPWESARELNTPWRAFVSPLAAKHQSHESFDGRPVAELSSEPLAAWQPHRYLNFTFLPIVCTSGLSHLAADLLKAKTQCGLAPLLERLALSFFLLLLLLPALHELSVASLCSLLSLQLRRFDQLHPKLKEVGHVLVDDADSSFGLQGNNLDIMAAAADLNRNGCILCESTESAKSIVQDLHAVTPRALHLSHRLVELDVMRLDLHRLNQRKHHSSHSHSVPL
mmetsp:Transcript_161781/g.310728  ORF Transcript_161781/g.310728 Transcript_161781/m.310728 type:complete len:236 (+) Transcript_161781:349-1056(+)